MSFSEDVKRFCVKAKGDMNVVSRQVALQLFYKVILRTPVGNPSLWKSKAAKGYVGGRARNNWNVSISPQPSAGVARKADASGTAAMNRMIADLGKWNPAQSSVVWLANGLPYMSRLEYEGWSSQAPDGMVRVSLGEIKAQGVGKARAMK